MGRRSGAKGWWRSLCVAICVASPVPVSASELPRKPNILVVLADDLGWRDVGFHGSEIATPNIDRLVREGVELDRFYVQPTCSPTRAGLMTGKSPMRLGINRPISKNDARGLPAGEKILPQYLAEAGYQSLMVGKWHLGHHTPDMFPHSRGFEHFYGNVTGGIGYWDHNHGGGHDWQRNGETLREEGYSTALLADEAVRLIAARDRTRPTFLYLALNAPHLPNEAPEEAIARYASIEDENRRLHAAMVDEMDRAVGRVLDAFESNGMLENTIVLFSSDNGGLVFEAAAEVAQTAAGFLVSVFGRPVPVESLEFLVANVYDGGSDNRPLPTGKGNIGEGGSRVPASLWWPARLRRFKHEGFMTISDVLPTLLDAIGEAARIPKDLDGRSQWAALQGASGGSETPDYVTRGMLGMAVYRAPWKLHATDPPQLYDIYAGSVRRARSCERTTRDRRQAACRRRGVAQSTGADTDFVPLSVRPRPFWGAGGPSALGRSRPRSRRRAALDARRQSLGTSRRC